MVEISGLFVYPIKSCQGILLKEVQVGTRGFRHDREFLVVDENDSFLTQRNAPDLATVQAALGENELILHAPGASEIRLALGSFPGKEATVRTVTIFRDQVVADDTGDELAEWFSGVLGRRSRLVRLGEKSTRKVPLERTAQSSEVEASREISFTDAFPTLLISEASLADLNSRLAVTLLMNRFRPNIVVKGAKSYEEDRWESVQAGEMTFLCSASCLRCIIATTDQTTGLRDGAEPLATLATYRTSPAGKGVMFGQYLQHGENGKLQLGDVLTATFR